MCIDGCVDVGVGVGGDVCTCVCLCNLCRKLGLGLSNTMNLKKFQENSEKILVTRGINNTFAKFPLPALHKHRVIVIVISRGVSESLN